MTTQTQIKFSIEVIKQLEEQLNRFQFTNVVVRDKNTKKKMSCHAKRDHRGTFFFVAGARMSKIDATHWLRDNAEAITEEEK